MGICVDSFFNVSVSWNSPRPQFSNCLKLSCLTFPCAAFWFLLLPYCVAIHAHKHQTRLPWSRLSCAKLVLLTLLFILTAADGVFEAVGFARGDHEEILKFLSPAILAVTLVAAAVVAKLERSVGWISSPLHFFLFFLIVIVGIVPLYSFIDDAVTLGKIAEMFPFVGFIVFYFLVIVLLILNSFSDSFGFHHDANGNPLSVASVLSAMTFWWLNKIVYHSFSKGLKPEDVFLNNHSERVLQNYEELNTEWEKLQRRDLIQLLTISTKHLFRRPKERGGSTLTLEVVSPPPTEETPLLQAASSSNALATRRSETEGSEEEESEEGKIGPPPGSARALRAKKNLFRAILFIFGPTLLLSWLFKFFYDILGFANPILLQVLLGYTTNKEEPTWHGWVYAGAYFLLAIVASVCSHQCFFIGKVLALRIRVALTSMVYKKAMKISSEARGESTVGEILNLMSVDTERISEVVPELWIMWSTVIELTIGIFLLWQQIGAATLAGLGIVVLFIPINGVVMMKLEKYEEKEMESKDNRIKTLSELLNGIKIVKLYAWERSYDRLVGALRKRELSFTKKNAYGWSVIIVIWCIVPYLILVVSFATYLYTGTDHVLTAQKAFVSLTIFNMLQNPMMMFPEGITGMINAYVSLKRLSRFLDADEIDEDLTERRSRDEDGAAILVANGTFSWTREGEATVNKVNFAVQKGELAAVLGPVGCGKSSLLLAILGEMERIRGQVVLRGSVAYVPQLAWIQNMTVKENILFGNALDQAWYDRVVDACALRTDIALMEAGDETEIGEKGINLSGGQKQRISLARAVYSKSDVYILDDPLSAVDASVGKHIFEKVLGPKGLLKDTTRLLTTNAIHFLSETDQIVVLNKGCLSEIGPYDELIENPESDFAKFVREHGDDASSSSEVDDDHDSGSDVTPFGSPSSDAPRPRLHRQSTSEKLRLVRQISRKSSVLAEDKASGRLIEEEDMEMGTVHWKDFAALIRARGIFLSFVMLLSFVVFQGVELGASVWISKWTDDPLFANYTPGVSDKAAIIAKTDYYMLIFGMFGLGEMITVSFFAYMEVITSIRAAAKIHQNLLVRILHAPISFFDTTPVGRILNRFDRDMEVIDHQLMENINGILGAFLGLIGSLIIVSISTPLFLAFVVPVALVYFLIQRFYIPISRQSRRIESVTRSPLYNSFTESVQGAQVIRAYQEDGRFTSEFDNKVDHNSRFTYLQEATEQWLGFRLELLGAVVVLVAVILAVVERDTLSPGIVGLSISYAMRITEDLNHFIGMLSEMETNAVAVERIEEYGRVEQEDDWEKFPPPDPDWPQHGKVEMQSFSTRYRPGMDLVLRSLNAEILPGEKIGVVGRTGAGKSSLTLAMFRLIEAAEGRISIDGLTIEGLGLHQLRTKLTILPQDPVLFSGSLRYNLDPFSRYDDSEIYTALERAHLGEWVHGLEKGLQHEVGEGGSNLSVGQRQLVCLSRALLRRSRILFLDEATAAVDLETDRLVMDTIKTEFKDSTVIIIAHRLSTVMDMDRVMVLDKGRIQEFDSPDNLLQNYDGIFYSLAQDAGLV